MKNLLRLLGIIALVAAIGFNLAGCGGDDGGSDTPTTPPPTTPTTPTTPTSNCTFDTNGWNLNPSAVRQSHENDGQEWNLCTNHNGEHALYRTLYAWGSVDDGLVLTLNAAQTEYNVGINTAYAKENVFIPAYYGYRRYLDANDKEVKVGNYGDFKPVKGIDTQAFKNNATIVNVTFLPGTQLTTISERAFASCSKLKTITIPADVTTIDKSVFEQCAVLETVTFGQNSKLTTISEGAFDQCAKLDKITIPSGVTTIGVHAFDGCKALSGINIPAGITTISEATFNNCEKLKTVTFAPNHGVVTIGKNAFAGCEALDTLTRYIPNGFVTIGELAFSGCVKIDYFEITDTVTSVGANAFKEWTKTQRIKVWGKTAAPATWDAGWNGGQADVQFVP